MKPYKRKELIDGLWSSRADTAKCELWCHDKDGNSIQNGGISKDVFNPHRQYEFAYTPENVVRYATLDCGGRIVEAFSDSERGKTKMSAKELDELLEETINQHKKFEENQNLVRV